MRTLLGASFPATARPRGATRVRLGTLALLLCCAAGSALADEPRPARRGRSRTVTIESAPPGAAIYLDDRRYGVVGYTPWKGKVVEGAYKLILAKEGFHDKESDITVDRRNTRFTIGLERDLRAFIAISTASDANVQGATVRIDGQARGAAPLEVEVQAGRHLVALEKAGFLPFEQWVELQPGQKLALAPALKAEAAAPGSLLVDANVPGAAVRIDGKAHPDPTPTVVEGLQPGPHVVEVSVAGAPAWKGTVTVKSGERVKVSAEIAVPKPVEKPTSGSLLLDADQPGAHAAIDGKALPDALPTVAEGLVAGPHVVEIRKDGFAPWKKSVTVVAGERLKVSATMQPLAAAKTEPKAPPPTGTLRVRAKMAGAWKNGADVLLDGKKMGVSPLDLRKVVAGRHKLMVVAGDVRGEGEVSVKADTLVEVVVELAQGGPAKLVLMPEKPLPGAKPAAQQPPQQQPSPPQPQPQQPQQPQTQPQTQPQSPPQTQPQPQQPTQPQHPTQPLQAAPQQQTDPMAEGPSPMDEPISRMPSSFGARVLPYGALTLDLGLGYPWYVDLRGTAGLLKDRFFGMDASIHVRSNFLRTEGLMRMRFRLADGGPFAAAAFATIGGGTGTAGRNSFTFQTGVSGSVFFGDRAALSVRAWLDTWSDRLCAAKGSEEFDAKEGPDVCYENLALTPSKEKRVRDLLGSTDVQDRDGGLRFQVGATLEIAISQRTNLYFSVDTAPAQGERASVVPLFHEAMAFTEDPVMSGQFGLTFKF